MIYFSSLPRQLAERAIRDVPAGTAVAVTSLFRLRTTLPYLVPHVEAPDPNIIMGHLTSERTMTPAMAKQEQKLPATRWAQTPARGGAWCGDLGESADVGGQPNVIPHVEAPRAGNMMPAMEGKKCLTISRN
jgi:hypothetical protein